MNFTVRLREELAHAPPGPECCRLAETAAMLRLGGALHLSDKGVGWVATVGNGAVARRLHSTLRHLLAVRPQVEVHRPTALRPTRYRLVLPPPLHQPLETLGLLDAQGRPIERVSSMMTKQPHDAAAYLRGALMVAGSVSDPRRPAHLEVAAPGKVPAQHLARVLARCGGTGARAAEHAGGWRVSCKSGAAVGAVLARAGAHAAFLEWDGERLRRELRGEANRATNADQANLGRAVDAAARQVAGIESAVAALGWDALPEDLRTTALARLANPEASLGELGALHEPPVGKATVHRRLARLAGLAEPAGEAG